MLRLHNTATKALSVFCAALALPALSQSSVGMSDVMVGTFESESRANFGTEPPGAARIEVAPPVSGRYAVTMFVNGKQLWKHDLIQCDLTTEPYLQRRVPGRGFGLCTIEMDGRPSTAAVLLYAENGLRLPAIKEKYLRNPDLVKQEGLAPGDPRLMEERHHKARYYAHVQWAFYAFRKVNP